MCRCNDSRYVEPLAHRPLAHRYKTSHKVPPHVVPDVQPDHHVGKLVELLLRPCCAAGSIYIRAVRSRGGGAGALPPQRKLYLRFLECHCYLFFGYFSAYRPYCPSGEKILRTALIYIQDPWWWSIGSFMRCHQANSATYIVKHIP